MGNQHATTNRESYNRFDEHQPYDLRPIRAGKHGKPRIEETTLHVQEVVIERKVFKIAMKENMRGTFMRITEDNPKHHNTLIIPEDGVKDFLAAVKSVYENAQVANK